MSEIIMSEIEEEIYERFPLAMVYEADARIVYPKRQAFLLAALAEKEDALKSAGDILRERDRQIAVLKAENASLKEKREIWEERNVSLETKYADLTANRDAGFELAMTESEPDYKRVPRLYSLVQHLTAENKRLRDMAAHHATWEQFVDWLEFLSHEPADNEALRGEKEDI